jgi:hypothetical protein
MWNMGTSHMYDLNRSPRSILGRLYIALSDPCYIGRSDAHAPHKTSNRCGISVSRILPPLCPLCPRSLNTLCIASRLDCSSRSPTSNVSLFPTLTRGSRPSRARRDTQYSRPSTPPLVPAIGAKADRSHCATGHGSRDSTGKTVRFLSQWSASSPFPAPNSWS